MDKRSVVNVFRHPLHRPYGLGEPDKHRFSGSREPKGVVLYSPDMRSLSLVLFVPEETAGESSEGLDSLTIANHLT